MRPRSLPLFSVALTIALSFPVFAESPVQHPIDTKLGGPESPYTRTLIGLLSNWEAAKAFCDTTKLGRTIHTIGMKTKGRPYYIGFKKCALIDAPLTAIAEIKDDVAHYHELFPGVKPVIVTKKDGNMMTLLWERIIPVFFVNNVKYRLSYLHDKTNPNRFIYRLQLAGGERLTANDGLEVIEKMPDGKSLFVNYEFYEADYSLGFLGMTAVKPYQLWKESLDGSYRSVLAIRTKAENPDWSYEKVLKSVEQQFKKLDPDPLEYQDPPPTTTSAKN